MASQVAFQQIVERVRPGATLARVWVLDGGTSAKVTALMINAGDAPLMLVVRQYGAANLLTNPHSARDEFSVLAMLHAAGVPVPEPHFADESRQLLPVPYLVAEFVEGVALNASADIAAATLQMADALAVVHRVRFAEQAVAFLPRQVETAGLRVAHAPPVLDDMLDERRVRDALRAVWPPAAPERSVLLHGDFWPGNLLWQAGRLTAILDWEDAAVGAPAADVANARLEIQLHWGRDAMEAFTNRYVTAVQNLDAAELAVWDLYAALRMCGQMGGFGLPAPTARQFAHRHGEFVEAALQALGLGAR